MRSPSRSIAGYGFSGEGILDMVGRAAKFPQQRERKGDFGLCGINVRALSTKMYVPGKIWWADVRDKRRYNDRYNDDRRFAGQP